MVIGMILLLVVLILCVVGWMTSRAGYESAPYTVILKDGRFEVRDYPVLTVVETPMASGRRDGADGSFMKLFRYITGGNEGEQKIAMTTPVFMSGEGATTTMAFVLPAGMSANSVPKPKDASVMVQEWDKGRYAIFRFSGGRNGENEAVAFEKLKVWMESKGMSGLSRPVYAYFDPPWTPSFMRRNEVMIRTEAVAKK